MHTIKTFGELKKANYQSKGIKDELRDNLIRKIKANEPIFNGILGYDDTVIPQLKQAILAKHNINLLGLRGQAKTRIARLMVDLLDDYIPFVAGSEINDDPFNPISRFAKDLLLTEGDNTPIAWLHKSNRFSEKLATPDVTVADLIGDIDPIKASNLKLSYADDRVLHFGMIPRANRCIFVINELPDLQARIQVSLFNILQEGDMQIRGFKMRLPLDLQFIFTANPEDYTNRGSIVTPLKDRIGSQILTHYPLNVDLAKQITKQEVKIQKTQENIIIPDLAYNLIELLSFEARNNDYIDAKSGVSARLSITALECILASAELRMLSNNLTKTTIRLADFDGAIQAITGKVELVYEGEQEGAEDVAKTLIEDASSTLFFDYFPTIPKLEKNPEKSAYYELENWFLSGNDLQLTSDLSDEAYAKRILKVKPLTNLLAKYAPDFVNSNDEIFMLELILWGLASKRKLNKIAINNGFNFGDTVGNMLKDIKPGKAN